MGESTLRLICFVQSSRHDTHPRKCLPSQPISSPSASCEAAFRTSADGDDEARKFMLLGHGLWEAERLAQIMSDLIFRQLPGMKKSRTLDPP